MLCQCIQGRASEDEAMRGYYYYYISSLSVVKRIVLPVPAADSSSAESSEDRRGAKTNCFSRKSFLCRLLVLVVRVKDKLWEMIRGPFFNSCPPKKKENGAKIKV